MFFLVFTAVSLPQASPCLSPPSLPSSTRCLQHRPARAHGAQGAQGATGQAPGPGGSRRAGTSAPLLPALPESHSCTAAPMAPQAVRRLHRASGQDHGPHGAVSSSIRHAAPKDGPPGHLHQLRVTPDASAGARGRAGHAPRTRVQHRPAAQDRRIGPGSELFHLSNL